MSRSKTSEKDNNETYDLDLDAADGAEAAIREAMRDLDDERPDEVLEVEVLEDDGDEGTEGRAEDEASLVSRLEGEIQDLRERSVRTLADFENYRRRVEREREDHRRYAAAGALTDFLAVIDNLERALQAKGSEADLRVGVEMIHRQMLDLLQRFGAKPVAAMEQPFDPMEHEAVSRVESRDVAQPTVVAEHQRGYRLHDRLLRPAMVTVAVPVDEANEDGDTGAGESSKGEVGLR